MLVILDSILRDKVHSIYTAGAGVRVMCICWSSMVLLPCIGKMKLTYHLDECPTSTEMAGCVSWVSTQLKSLPMMISQCPVCNRCGTSA